MSSIRVLLVGESWVSTSTHVKGWDFFTSSEYSVGTEYLVAALASDDEHAPLADHEIAEAQPQHLAPAQTAEHHGLDHSPVPLGAQGAKQGVHFGRCAHSW